MVSKYKLFYSATLLKFLIFVILFRWTLLHVQLCCLQIMMISSPSLQLLCLTSFSCPIMLASTSKTIFKIVRHSDLPPDFNGDASDIFPVSLRMTPEIDIFFHGKEKNLLGRSGFVEWLVGGSVSRWEQWWWERSEPQSLSDVGLGCFATTPCSLGGSCLFPLIRQEMQIAWLSSKSLLLPPRPAPQPAFLRCMGASLEYLAICSDLRIILCEVVQQASSVTRAGIKPGTWPKPFYKTKD